MKIITNEGLQMNESGKYLSNLTPLRGVAALWVVVFHFQVLVAQFIQPNQSQLFYKGYLMVDLFFIMSGFIILHVYGSHFQFSGSLKNFRDFIVARFARIYPLHIFTLLVLVLMIASSKSWNPVDDKKAILSNILLMHSFGIHKIFTWNVPSWSISAEWWAYMIFPFISLGLYHKKKVTLIFAVIFVITAYIAIMFILPRKNPFNPAAIVPHNLDVTYDYGFLRGLAGFICGMIIYQVYQIQSFKRFFKKDITAFIFIIIAITCLHIGINDGLYIPIFAALVLCFACNQATLHHWCNNKALQYLGKISYSIYLMQLFVGLPFFSGAKLPGVHYTKMGIGNTVSFWLGLGYCLIYLGLLVGLSTLTYYLIEKPCRKFINAKWGNKNPPVFSKYSV